MNTVRFLSAEEIDRLKEEGFVEKGSHTHGKVVNLRLLRDYIESYLRSRDDVNQEMTLMVRQLPPTNSGLPIQLYFFTGTTEWVKHEHVMADIFDHVYATINAFGLNIFQTPAGTDLKNLRIPSPQP